MKLCRFLPIRFFNLDGSIILKKDDLIKFFEDYSLSRFGLEKEVAKKAYADVSSKGFISQRYLDLIEKELKIINGLAPRILGVYLDPKLVYNGIIHNGKITRLKNSITEIIDGKKPLISKEEYTLSDITFLSPVDVINHYVLWNNYNNPNLENPVFLSKSPSAIVGDSHPIMLKKEFLEQDLNPESELAVYFNKPLINQSVENLRDLIKMGDLGLGLTIENDVTWQDPAKKIPAEASRIKSQYSFAPIGPYLELNPNLDEVINREMRLYLNNEKKQEGVVKNLRFGILETLSYYSYNFLTSGPTLISLGTNGQNLQRLNPGDVVECEITNLGKLKNPVVTYII